MAQKAGSLSAYNFNLFEDADGTARQLAPKEEPRRQSPGNITQLPQHQLEKSRKKRVRPVKMVASILCVALILSILGTLVYGQVQIMELSQQITNANEELNELKSVELQLDYSKSAGYSTAQAGEYAQKYLGMSKISAGQITYVGVNAQDGGEVVQQARETGFFENLLHRVAQLFA